MASEAWTLVERRHRRNTRGEKGSTQNSRGEPKTGNITAICDPVECTSQHTEGLRAGRAGEARAREGTDVTPPHQHDILIDDDDDDDDGSKTTPSDYPKREANSWKQITVTKHNVQGCNNDQKEKKDMIANLLCSDTSPAVYLLQVTLETSDEPIEVDGTLFISNGIAANTRSRGDRKHTKFKVRRLLSLGGTGHH